MEVDEGQHAGGVRRSIRTALHHGDPAGLKDLVDEGADVNMAISEVFLETPLICAVKCGYLEIVEMLLGLPSCDIDLQDRHKHSALDEAIRALLKCATSAITTEQELGRRYRILIRLLVSGAKHLTENLLTSQIFSTVISKRGNYVIGRLIKAVCERGHQDVQNGLLKCLLPYRNISLYIRYLLSCGADPKVCSRGAGDQQMMSLENAILLATASSDAEVLNRVEQDTSCTIKHIDDECQWQLYCRVLKLLCLSGYQLQLFVMNYLYYNHAKMYLWVSHYRANPPPLCHLARISVRRCFQPSVFIGIHKLVTLPEKLRTFLVFRE